MKVVIQTITGHFVVLSKELGARQDHLHCEVIDPQDATNFGSEETAKSWMERSRRLGLIRELAESAYWPSSLERQQGDLIGALTAQAS